MKKLSLVLFILVTLLIPNISQSSISNLLNQSDDQKEIDLRGSLDQTSTRSVLQTPIYATIGSTSLDVDFLSNLGVEVYSLLGNSVYENKVNTQMQQKVSINVSDWDSGVYEIRFVDSDGNYMYGTFEIGL